ncbi:MAG: hypothetical protein IJ875_03495 [Solobacterium sp.]|nr:hypothetical protein [Solobacterium sp.]
MGGIITAYILNAQDYSLSTWISAYFLGTLPAILAHLFIVPMIVIALKKAGLLK